MTIEKHERTVLEGDECRVPGLEFLGRTQLSNAEPFGLSAHSHGGAYEICFVKRGTVEWYVGEDTYQVQPGNVFLTKPGEVHGGLDDTMHPCQLYWALFQLDEPKGCFALSSSAAAALDQAFNTLQSRCAKAPAATESYFDRMFSAVERDDAFSESEINASMQLLLIDTLAAFRSAVANTTAARQYSKNIRAALNRVRKDVGSVSSVNDMAEDAGLKGSQFRELFKTETGFSPIEFLTFRRVQRAKELLSTSNNSVTDIALEVGFRSSQYFATCFKRMTGTSPHHYRKANRIDQPGN